MNKEEKIKFYKEDLQRTKDIYHRILAKPIKTPHDEKYLIGLSERIVEVEALLNE